jgi:hypothetical protein
MVAVGFNPMGMAADSQDIVFSNANTVWRCVVRVPRVAGI